MLDWLPADKSRGKQALEQNALVAFFTPAGTVVARCLSEQQGLAWQRLRLCFLKNLSRYPTPGRQSPAAGWLQKYLRAGDVWPCNGENIAESPSLYRHLIERDINLYQLDSCCQSPQPCDNQVKAFKVCREFKRTLGVVIVLDNSIKSPPMLFTAEKN